MRRLFFLLIFASLMPVYSQESPRELPTHVLVILMDGARPDAIQAVDAPVLQGLAANGAVDWEAQTVLPSVTVPAHASLFTGLSVEEHGIDTNNYNTETLDLPSFLSIGSEAGIPSAMIVGKNKLDQFHYPQSVYYEFATSGDRSVVDVAIQRLVLGDKLLFIHLPNPDYFGHGTGWMSETYLYELGNTDRQVGRLLEAMEELGILDTSLIIITADHGGHEREHGSNLPEDQTIPIIFSGFGIQAGTVLEGTSITQIAATVLWALDLPIPEDADEPILEAFGLETSE
jgi:predicted AlkP superfamily pyrophosphatase or phosphodiesterase